VPPSTPPSQAQTWRDSRWVQQRRSELCVGTLSVTSSVTVVGDQGDIAAHAVTLCQITLTKSRRR